MAATPAKYQANPRLVDDPDQLRKLYCEDGLTIREIAENHAAVGRTKVSESLTEYGITDDSDDDSRDVGPPTTNGDDGSVDWTAVS